MTAPITPGDTSPAGDGAPVVDDNLVHVDAQLHTPGQPPGWGGGPTRPNIIRAFPSDNPDPFAPETRDVQPGAPLEQPEHGAAKAEWVEFAVSQGVDRDEAEKTKKDDLVSRFSS